MNDAPRLRSKLYVPGNKARWLKEALASEADGLVIDLEDSVPEREKEFARARVADFVAEHRRQRVLLVRVARPQTAAFLADVTAMVEAGARGIVVPKADGPTDIQVASRLLDWLEEEHGVPLGSTLIVPILETASAIRGAFGVGTASPRVAYMGGIAPRGGDVQRAIGYRWSKDGWESLPLRAKVLLDARAAGVPNPMTGLWTSVGDLDGLRTFARQGRDLGYDGMAVIHPSHLPVVNEIFATPPEELAYYGELLDAVASAEADGTSATVFRGHMVDSAMAATAREQLERERENE